MVTRATTNRTELLNNETKQKLREADEVTRYQECGWHCAIGFIGDKVHVKVHANSAAELDRALGLGPKDDPVSTFGM